MKSPSGVYEGIVATFENKIIYFVIEYLKLAKYNLNVLMQMFLNNTYIRNIFKIWHTVRRYLFCWMTTIYSSKIQFIQGLRK